jgi:hypothetical protein
MSRPRRSRPAASTICASGKGHATDLTLDEAMQFLMTAGTARAPPLVSRRMSTPETNLRQQRNRHRGLATLNNSARRRLDARRTARARAVAGPSPCMLYLVSCLNPRKTRCRKQRIPIPCPTRCLACFCGGTAPFRRSRDHRRCVIDGHHPGATRLFAATVQLPVAEA